MLDIHVAVFLFGLAGLFGKWLALPAWGIVLGRTVFAAAALGLVLFISGERRLPGERGTVAQFALLGLILAAHWTTFFHAIQVSSVAVGLLSFSTFPVFITVIEPYWFNEKRRAIDMVTTVLVVAGIGIMIYPSPLGGRIYAGVWWGTLSGFTFALLSLLNRKWVRQYPPAVIALYQNAVAAASLSPMLLGPDLHLDGAQVGLLALLGVVCTAFSHALFIRGLTVVRTQLASVIACLEPVYGIIFAYLLLRERPSAYTVAGGMVILLATVVATLRRASD
ncbi:MAG TPA: DMT family transporter [Desulfosarcina sp.]|nr:DMT family transporter [Desulfosarcina sp.]